MPEPHDVWIPLVDEPIGSVVTEIEAQHPEISELVSTPDRILAFRTFAYIRVGLLLGQLLVDHELEPDDGAETWIDALLQRPEYHAQVVNEVRAVAEEIAADPSYAQAESLGPDEDAKVRFREFAKKRLESL